MASEKPNNPYEAVGLPEDFLLTPSPVILRSKIDWEKTCIPAYRNNYAVVLDNVLTPSECAAWLVAAENHADPAGWERAMINVGGGRQELYADVRNCGRIIWDDRELMARLWARIEPFVIEEIGELKDKPLVTGFGPKKRNEIWKMTRLNERMRFLKYVGGEYFKAHEDGTYVTPDGKERSYYTLHLYLNEKNHENPLEGGATTFMFDWNYETTSSRVDVEPKAGRVLLFQHRDMMHCGDDVRRGTKYTMRTDIMYRKVENEPNDSTCTPVSTH